MVAMKKEAITLGIVIPCYNEEPGIEETITRLEEEYTKLIISGIIKKSSFICLVDDGSSDDTWKIIKQNAKTYTFIRGIKLSRNFGQQNALIAGLMQLKDEADALITMDADLQDDIGILDKFIHKYTEGYEIIYGVREDRSKDTIAKRSFAKLFYNIQTFMGIESIPNHAHYRLMSKNAINALAKFNEINMYLRGVVPLLGFRSCSIYYKREKRFAGDTKYSISELFVLSIDGISSFSVVPLRIITITGLVLFSFSLIGIIWVLIEKLILHNAIQGWASTMVSIYFIGGIQVMSLGIIGEYIGRIYQQVKRRPRYIIESEV